MDLRLGRIIFKLVGLMIFNVMGVSWVERNYLGSVFWLGIWIRKISDLNNLFDIREYL